MIVKNRTDVPLESSWLRIAQHPDVLAVIPPGAILSLPVPAARLQSLCGFYYLRETEGQARIVVRFCGSLIQQDLFDLRRQETGPLFPDLDGQSIVIPERTPLPDEAYSAFYSALGTLLMLYAGREKPCSAGEVYWNALVELEPESAIPVYRALNPAFFTWLRSNSCDE